jgi:ubiquinone/menaquinone biosynthesis C-methylase UbiE
MQLPPSLYHQIVRPRWITKRYIHNHVIDHFPLEQQVVVDFGSGTGANCSLCAPSHYFGLEPDEERVEFARQLYPEYRFDVLRNHSLPVPDESADYLMIIAVLHHIATDEINDYMSEFIRILKPDGKIIVLEPCLCDQHPYCNRFMQWYDEGNYLRNEEEYVSLFHNHNFQCKVHHRFRKCLLYHELLFCAEFQH